MMVLFGGSILCGIFNAYLKYRYLVKADYIETRSTNCGNNITFLLELLEKEDIACKHIILSQDATMQYRMEMGMQLCRSYQGSKSRICYGKRC